MMDITTSDHEGRAEPFTRLRPWEIHSEPWRAPIPERKTATASWQSSVRTIIVLSTLAWAAIVLVVIAALARL